MKSAHKALLGAALAFCIAVAGACGLFKTPMAPSGYPDAVAVVEGLATAWNVATTTCLAAEGAGQVKPGSCAKALIPAHDALMAAAAAADAWKAGAENTFPCAVALAATSLSDVETLLLDAKVNLPPAIAEGVSLARSLGALCPAPDGTAGGTV